MIKVLKKRNKIKCNVCKSKLTFEPEDVHDKCTTYRDVSWEDHSYYVICPVCKAKVVLSDKVTIF